MDDVARIGGAHARKRSGICWCINDTLMNMHLYMHVYINYFPWELSICLDIKVRGFSMYIHYGDWSDICDIDIWLQQVLRVKYLVGLPPKLKLLAVLSSSDTMAGMYTVGLTLL